MLLFVTLNLITNPIILAWCPFMFITEIKVSCRYYLQNRFLLSVVWHLKGYPEFTVSIENSYFNCKNCGTNEMRKHHEEKRIFIIKRRKQKLKKLSSEENPNWSLRHSSQRFYLAILHISFPPEILHHSPLPGITITSYKGKYSTPVL